MSAVDPCKFYSALLYFIIDLLRCLLELSTCLCDFSLKKKKNCPKCNATYNFIESDLHSEVDAKQKKARKSSGSAKVDFSIVAYQIFSSIGWRGVKREEKQQ